MTLWGLRDVLRAFWKVQEKLQEVPLPLGKDGLEFIEHELHYLALEHHVDRHIGWLGLGAEQCGAEHDGDTLNRHPVGLFVLDHPGERNSRMWTVLVSFTTALFPAALWGNVFMSLLFVFTFIKWLTPFSYLPSCSSPSAFTGTTTLKGYSKISDIGPHFFNLPSLIHIARDHFQPTACSTEFGQLAFLSLMVMLMLVQVIGPSSSLC